MKFLLFSVLTFGAHFAIAQVDPNQYTKVPPSRARDYRIVMVDALEKSGMTCQGVSAIDGEKFESPLPQIVAIVHAAQEVYLKKDMTQPVLLFVTFHGNRRIESLITTNASNQQPEQVDIVQDDTITTIINDGDLTNPILREEKNVVRTATGICQKQLPPLS